MCVGASDGEDTAEVGCVCVCVYVQVCRECVGGVGGPVVGRRL